MSQSELVKSLVAVETKFLGNFERVLVHFLEIGLKKHLRVAIQDPRMTDEYCRPSLKQNLQADKSD